MEVRVKKWRNSDGIKIPSSILKSLNIKTNDVLNVEKVTEEELEEIIDIVNGIVEI